MPEINLKVSGQVYGMLSELKAYIEHEDCEEYEMNDFAENLLIVYANSLLRNYKRFDPESATADTVSTVSEPVNKYGVSEDFEGDFDSWVAKGKPDRGHIYVGITSPALKRIGVHDGSIEWDTSKLNKIQRDHPDMSDSILRQVPSIIGSPILVMQSRTQLNRVTIYGEVYNSDGIPVLAVLELRPMRYGKLMLDTIKVANAYTREGGVIATQGIINNSSILYVNPDKTRTDTWLTRNRLQLPFGISKYGSVGKVTYYKRDVNGNYSFSGGNNANSNNLPEWKEKLKDIEIETDDFGKTSS